MKLPTHLIEEYGKEAFKLYKEAKQLPIVINHTFGNGDNFVIVVNDNKVFKHKFGNPDPKNKYILGSFEVELPAGLGEHDEMLQIDKNIGINPNVDAKTRIILRMSYTIYTIFKLYVLDGYTKVRQPGDPVATYANAGAGYKSL